MTTLTKKKKKTVKPTADKKRRLKKRRVKKKVSRGPSIEVAKDQLEQVSPAERIQHISRGLRLRFGGLPGQKKLSAQQREALNKEDVKNAERCVSQSTKLYDKHPEITKVNSAKGAVLALFHAKTLPFPEPGVRIFVLKTDHLDFEKQSEEEIERDFAAQQEAFSKEIQEKLADYDAAVTSLSRNWDKVMADQKQTFIDAGLEILFDPNIYPSADGLKAILYHEFRTFNVEPPRETNYMTAQERERILKNVEAQFNQAIEMQGTFVIQLLHDAINQMIESVTGFHNGEKRSFRNSVVERVFDAFKEFKEKTVKYGILRGTALESEFKRAMDFMTEGMTDEHTLPGILRQSPEKRSDLLEKMKMVGNSLGQLAENRKRRSVIKD
jgi:hypothetical protein